MENLDSLQKKQTSKACGQAKKPLAGGKALRFNFTLFPRHRDMKDELCRDYNINGSDLVCRLIEYEYQHRVLGAIRDAALKNPLYGPHPGVDHSDSHTLAAGKTLRFNFILYPRHRDMKDELCRNYNINGSQLVCRLIEYEYKHRVLRAIRDAVLQNPLYGPHPGLDHTHPET